MHIYYYITGIDIFLARDIRHW